MSTHLNLYDLNIKKNEKYNANFSAVLLTNETTCNKNNFNDSFYLTSLAYNGS